MRALPRENKCYFCRLSSCFCYLRYNPYLLPPFFSLLFSSLLSFHPFVANSVVLDEGGLYAWGKPHLGVGSGRVIGRPIRVASLQKVRVQGITLFPFPLLPLLSTPPLPSTSTSLLNHAQIGVAGGEWQTFAWVSSHDLPPPTPPSQWPWPKALVKISSRYIILYYIILYYIILYYIILYYIILYYIILYYIILYYICIFC